MELLKNPKMVGLVGVEYDPKRDFKFSSLTPRQQQEVLRHNPYFIKSNTEKETKGQEIAEEIKKDITKLKNLTHGHLSLFKDNIENILKEHPNLFDDLEVTQKLYDSGLKNILINHPDLFKKAPHIAEKLANDKNWYIRKRIAKHPDLFTKFPNLVEKFANDEDVIVRTKIAKHRDLFTKFPYLVEKLANDEEASVRVILKENAKNQGINLEQFIKNLKSQTQKSEKLTINKYLLLKKQTLFLNPNLKKRLYGKCKYK
jgi:hypothetical protein